MEDRGIFFWITLAICVCWFIIRPLASSLSHGNHPTSQAYNDGYKEGNQYGEMDILEIKLGHGGRIVMQRKQMPEQF